MNYEPDVVIYGHMNVTIHQTVTIGSEKRFCLSQYLLSTALCMVVDPHTEHFIDMRRITYKIPVWSW